MTDILLELIYNDIMIETFELVFVYNADSGIFSGIKDLVHKSVSPKTYECNLCGLTYGGISMKQDWKEFVENLPIKVAFLHKDEFIKKYPQLASVSFPVVFKKEGKTLEEFISSDEINKQKSLEDLKKLINTAIEK